MGNVVKERRRRGRRDGKQPQSQHQHAKGKDAIAPHRSEPPAQKHGATTITPERPGYKPHSTLLVQFTEETPTWYDCGRNTAGRDDTIFDADGSSGDGNSNKKNKNNTQQKETPRNTREVITKYRRLADEIYGHEAALARQGSGSGGGGASSYSDKDEKWVENTMRRGTLKDRVAAMSVVVGMDCVHKLHALDMLLDLAGCGTDGDGGAVPNARVGQMASEALSDLFVNTLLPGDRKLISLEDRPLFLYEGDRTLSPRVLLLWRYEEMIKQRYVSYLSRYLGRTLAGEDEPSKKAALSTACSLLMQVPEGEEMLLTVIVNKIGDPGRKIASAAGHQLRLILEEHPAMVNVVAREVQQLAHRPHLSPRALYSCVVFLNQLQLSRDDDDEEPDENEQTDKRAQRPESLPASLINTYFHLFEMTVKKDEAKKKGGAKAKAQPSSKDPSSSGMKSRLLGALLTGVNRAHPYLPKKDAAMEQHIDALYRISHTAPPAAATQALMLLFQLAVGSGDSAEGGVAQAVQKDDSAPMRKDRFYRALYSKLADTDMFAGRQLTLFFNLLYKAMKYDTSPERVSAYAKRLLHTALHLSSSVMCGSLFLLSEILKCHPELQRDVESAVSEAAFDPTKREPSAAFSGKVNLTKNLWELSLLAHHFHPSVSRFTADSNGGILFKGDPLKDFALTPFLDKFAFRNPKSLEKLSKQLKRGESIAERKSGLSGSTALPMNDPSYLQARNVSEEEKFFHRFFVERARRDGLKGIVRGSGADKDKEESDLEDEALHATEADDMIEADFDGDTDSEEEAFVNQLAEKLMESASNGKANLDEEDPDMDDWSDFDDDDDDDKDNGVEENKNEDNNIEHEESDDASADSGREGNEDAFMDAASSDEDEGGNVFGAMGVEDTDSDDGAPLPFDMLGEDGSDDDSLTRNDDKEPKKRKKGGSSKSSVFADADEYEKLLEEEAKALMHDDESGSAMVKEEISQKKKRRKKKN